jgi:hypothetical protein
MKSKVYFFIILFLAGLAVVWFLDLKDANSFYHEIILASHGIVLDLLVLGIVLTLYEHFTEKKNKIERYKEEIDDLRFWRSEEAMFRIIGIVKRLNKLGVKELDLSHCQFKNFPPFKDMTYWKFQCSSFINSHFIDIKLNGSNFFDSNIKNSYFIHSDLTACDFSLCILENVAFEQCVMNNVNFTNAYIENRNWFFVLENNENIGIDLLKQRFKISTATIKVKSKQFYQILDIDSNDIAKTENQIMLETINKIDFASIFGIIPPSNKE